MDNIFKAIFSENTKMLLESLDSGVDINIQDKEKRTPLIHAIIDNKIGIAEILIRKGADLDIQDSLGYTALHYAAQNYFENAVKLLLENKAKVDVQDIHGNTPLFRAVFNSKGRGEVIKTLLTNGANRNLLNKHGVSPLQLANTIGNYSITQFFE